jgi:hypothetical protein
MKLNFKTNSLDLSNFDFILNSIGYLYANPELTKCLFDDNDSKKVSVKFTSCCLEVLEELVYSKKKQNDSYVSFFLNSVKSFHRAHKCSTKTVVCFTVFLWRQIKFIFLQQNVSSNLAEFPGLSTRTFSAHLSSILEEIIRFVKDNSELLKIVNIKNSKIRFEENDESKQSLQHFVDGICRNQTVFSRLIIEIFSIFERKSINLSEFDSNQFSIIVSCPIFTLTTAPENTCNNARNQIFSNQFESKVKHGIHVRINELNYSLISKHGELQER